MFDYRGMQDLATRPPDGFAGSVLQSRQPAPWPVHPALAGIVPDGLRRGSTVSVAGSLSLLLAVLGGPSGEGAWCALVGLPAIGAEAALEYGVQLARAPVIADPGPHWTGLVGALLDTVDVVVARPPGRLVAGDVQRLTARARARGAVLVAYLDQDAGSGWPAADLRLGAQDSAWTGPAGGGGRLRGRRLTVTAHGRAKAARPRSAGLWLPAAGVAAGRVEPASQAPSGTVLPLPRTG